MLFICPKLGDFLKSSNYSIFTTAARWEVKRVLKAILELGLVMPHSGFSATLDPDPLKRFDPSKFFFQTLKIFLLNDLLGFPLNEDLWVKSQPFSGRVSRFAEFFSCQLCTLALCTFESLYLVLSVYTW